MNSEHTNKVTKIVIYSFTSYKSYSSNLNLYESVLRKITVQNIMKHFEILRENVHFINILKTFTNNRKIKLHRPKGKGQILAVLYVNAAGTSNNVVIHFQTECNFIYTHLYG